MPGVTLVQINASHAWIPSQRVCLRILYCHPSESVKELRILEYASYSFEFTQRKVDVDVPRLGEYEPMDDSPLLR